MAATALINIPGKVVSVAKNLGAKRGTVTIEAVDRSSGSGAVGAGYATGNVEPFTFSFEEDAGAMTDAFVQGANCTIRVTVP